MQHWQNKYRIPTARASWHDYARNGAYFVTICTQHHRCLLGRCQQGQLVLSTAGAVVQGLWYEIPRHFPFVQLGAFVVMPNHIHGVLIFDHPDDTPEGSSTMSSVIGAFKSVCSKHLHRAFPGMNFAWQRLFWDNIIRDERAFEHITRYILNNPAAWDKDRFYTV